MESTVKDAFWFKHDSNAQHDERVMELRAEYGWEGYGIFWALVERMRDAPDYRLSMATLGGLATGMGIRKPLLVGIIDLACKHGLLALEEEAGYFYAPSLRRRMEQWDEKKAVFSEAGKKGAERKKALKEEATLAAEAKEVEATLKPPLSQLDSSASREEKSRKEERRTKDARAPARSSASGSERVCWPDEAPVFQLSAFFAFAAKIGFAHADRGLYLSQIQHKAESLNEQRPNAGWEDFIFRYFNNEVKYDRLMLANSTPEAKPPPAKMPDDPRAELWGWNDPAPPVVHEPIPVYTSALA